VTLADLGFFFKAEGDFGNPSERASIEGVWAYGRMTFERLSPGFRSRRGTKRHRNNLSHIIIIIIIIIYSLKIGAEQQGRICGTYNCPQYKK